MTELEKSFLKLQGYSDFEINNWNEEENWDFRKSDSFEMYKNGYEQGAKDIDVLTKENAELKDLLEKKIKENLVLENDSENLKQENEKLNEQAIFGRERAKKIIIEFFKWYSENKDGVEADKYADNFLSEYFEHSANVMNQYEEWYGDKE